MSEQQRAIVIEGKTLEMPSPDSFSISEWKVVYKYAGLVLTDFLPADPQWSKGKIRKHDDEFETKIGNPGYTQALVHIAYLRDDPTVDQYELEQMIEGMNLLRAVNVFGLEADTNPPEKTDSPSELEKPSNSRPLLSSADSVSPSPNGSDQLAEIPEATGIGESTTSSPLSALTT